MTKKARSIHRADGKRWWLVVASLAATSIVAALVLVSDPDPKISEPSVQATAAMRTISVKPRADAFVDARKPGRNFGGARNLVVKKSVRKAYLRFLMRNLPGNVSKATLRVYTRNRSSGLKVGVVARDGWQERKITHRNAPRRGVMVGSSRRTQAGGWATINVTELVNRNGPVSLAVVGKGSKNITLSSKEGSRAPKLVVRTTSSGPFVPRGLWREDEPNLADIRSLRFNLLTVNPNEPDLDRLRNSGLKGLIWLGGYDNDECEFSENNAWVLDKIGELGDHPAAYAWFIDDEPHADCPNVREDIRGRSDLIKNNLPGALTVVSENEVEAFDELANTTDVLVIVSYPCSHEDGCVYDKVDDDVQAAKEAGVPRFWGAIQAFGEEYYKMPNNAETRELFRTWNRTGMGGYMAYIWRSDGEDETLEDHEELWDAWTNYNSSPLP